MRASCERVTPALKFALELSELLLRLRLLSLADPRLLDVRLRSREVSCSELAALDEPEALVDSSLER